VTNPPESLWLRAARWLTFGSAVSIMLGIAPSQILLALAVVALLLSGAPLRLPPIKLPLALFMLGTILSLVFSSDPAAGLPQIRKLLLFFYLLVVFSSMRSMAAIRRLFLAWSGIASIAAILGFVQFATKVRQAHALGRNFYDYYVGERITGFMSHWNTFSAEEMFTLIMLGAFLLFAPAPRKRLWLWISAAALIALAVLLAETRIIWVGTAVAAAYLMWFWRRWLVLAIPAAAALVILVSPPAIRERFTSVIRPRQVDSNAFRIVTWRTGMCMIEAHPLLGLGPEEPRIQFDQWVPADIPRPLPEGSYIHLHNIYLQYAAERGIPTLLILLWMLGKVLCDFWRGLRTPPSDPSDRRWLLHGGIAVVLATLAEGFAEYNLGDSEVLTMFLVVIACGYLAMERDVAEA